MQILPHSCHYTSVTEMRNEILTFSDNFKLPFELYDANSNFLKPDADTFEVLIRKSNEKVLIPDSTHYPFLYRGQNSDHGPCLPTLFRNDSSEIQIFIERLRLVEFEFLINQHPVVNTFFLRNNFKINYVGLAQHYGLKTHLIDLTNDIDIALFFAMSQYNKVSDKYEYFKTGIKSQAVLYVVVPTFFLSQDKDTFLDNKISIIGYQPFLRPAIQKGFAYTLERHEDFKALKYTFDFTTEDSQSLYEKFGNGEKLWIKDILAEKAIIISTKMQFSIEIFNRTFELYPVKGISKNKIKKLLLDSNISISTHNEITSFSRIEINDIVQKWNSEQVNTFISQIRRKFWYEVNGNNEPGEMHDFRTLDMLRNTEMLRLLGNKSGLEEDIKKGMLNPTINSGKKIDNQSPWEEVPAHFVLTKSEIFLKKENCLIENVAI